MHSKDTRICAVNVYHYMGSMRRASAAVGVSVASICRWVSHITAKGWPPRGSRIVNGVEAAMKLILDKEPHTTANQLRCCIKQQFDIDASRQLIALILRKRIYYTWKRTRKRGPRGSGWTDEKIAEFKTQFRSAYDRGVLSSWDES